MEVVRHLAECSDPLFHGPCLDVADMFATYTWLHVLGVISLMRRHQIVVQGDGILNKLDYTGIRRQRQHLIRPDPEISLPSGAVVFEEIADLLKDLLHDSILSQIIITSLKLDKTVNFSRSTNATASSYQLFVA